MSALEALVEAHVNFELAEEDAADALQAKNELTCLFHQFGQNADEVVDVRKTLQYILGGKPSQTAPSPLTDHNPARVSAALGDALANFRQTGDTKRETVGLLLVARHHANVGEYDEAVKNLDSAFVTANSTDFLETIVLHATVEVLLMKGAKGEAVEAADKLLAVFKDASNRKGEGAALQTKALVFLQTGDPVAALDLLGGARSACEDTRLEVSVLHSMMEAQSQQDDFRSMEGTARQLRTVFKGAGVKDGEADALSLLAHMSIIRGDSEEAVKHADEATEAVKEGDGSMAVAVLRLAVNAHLLRGDGKEAKRVVTEALAGLVSGDKARESEMLTIMSSVYLSMGDGEGALVAGGEAVTAGKGVKGIEASALLAVADAHQFVKEGSSEALKAAKDAVSFAQRSGMIGLHANALRSLAAVHLSRRDTVSALQVGRESLALYQKAADWQGEQSLWDNLLQYIPGSAFTPQSELTPPSDGQLTKEQLNEAVGRRKKIPTGNIIHNDMMKSALPTPPVQAVIFGAALSDGSPSQWSVEFMRYLCELTAANLTVPVIVPTKGAFGRQMGGLGPASLTDASSLALWGLIRTTRQEIPRIPVVLCDFPFGTPSAEIGKYLAPTDLETLYYHKTKFHSQIVQIDSLFRRDAKKDTHNSGAVKEKGPRFQRKAFKFGMPAHKLDYCWYRQNWVAGLPATLDQYTPN
mmetsp:Transcript_8946/g.24948  ORF Transcript_8946/g.24948 Transcript_8946/m.24948 type:complete len:697 (-) Transcript_8946:306-2396(-)|eukprot:CAMPEP_0194518894 /NCGR_PEP_ID=MMETSP0253-20130528/52398_1 /TAXON_ID=2966 /ORGANISM="Noctiluca scintillans" /LENGTH=696 /DNA_ID=CAMNT_0039362975 /DNA_START=36 /DNA_END=2126 /DNA_ORIENTATION=+